jgi:hypothetical protein
MVRGVDGTEFTATTTTTTTTTTTPTPTPTPQPLPPPLDTTPPDVTVTGVTFTPTPGGSGTFCGFNVDFCHLDVRPQASDAQSGIVDLRTFVQVFWFCGDGGTAATSMSEGSPDPVPVASTDQDHDTVLRQYGCDGQSPPGAGNPPPGSQVQGVSGEVFARATNGAGLVTESQHVRFGSGFPL